MRCHEARNRLNEMDWSDLRKAGFDHDLMEHLKSCSGCAAEARVVELMARAAKTPDFQRDEEAIPFSILRSRVEARQHQPGGYKENSIMSTLSRQLSRRPRLSIGLGVATVALLAATLIPISYDKTIGYQVAVAGVDPNLALDGTKMSEMLVKLGYGDAAIDVTDCSATCNVMISKLNSEDDAKVVMAAFNNLAFGFECKLELVNESATGNFFKVAQGTAIRFGDNPEGIQPDERANRMVIDRLGEDGGSMSFTFKVADGNGGQTIEFTPGIAEMTEDGLHWIAKEGVSGFIDRGELLNGKVECMVRNLKSCTLGDSGCKVAMLGGNDNIANNQDCFFFKSEDGTDLLKGGVFDQIHQLTDGIDLANLSDEDIRRLEAAGLKVQVSKEENGETHISISLEDGSSVRFGSSANSSFGAGDDPDPGSPENLPESPSLSQNYPNPFNPTTLIDFELPSSQYVSLEIYNIRGQKVTTLVDGVRSAGRHTVEWDATNDGGAKVASGTYFYRLTAGDQVQKKKMTLLK